MRKKMFTWMIIAVMMVASMVLGACTASVPQAPQVQQVPAVTPDSQVMDQLQDDDQDNGQVVPPMDAPVKEITIDMFDWGFNQDGPAIRKGDRVRLKISSSQGTHGIAFPDLGISTGRIAPGGEEVFEFVANEEGSFTYYCNVPCGSGHKSMRAELVVGP